MTVEGIFCALSRFKSLNTINILLNQSAKVDAFGEFVVLKTKSLITATVTGLKMPGLHKNVSFMRTLKLVRYLLPSVWNYCQSLEFELIKAFFFIN